MLRTYGYRSAAPVALLILVSENAFAYIDPGTGTLLIQWLFGMVVAGFAVLNLYWARAKHFFATKFGSAPSQEPESSSDEARSD